MSTVGPVSEEWVKMLNDGIVRLEDNLDSGDLKSIPRDAYVRIYTLCYQLCTASDDNCSYLYDRCVEVSFPIILID